MSFVHAVLSLPAGVLLAVSAVVIVLLALWLSSLFSRWHYVTIRRSEETELISFHLRRLADAVERLSIARETQPSVETTSARPIGISVSGR